ncbi:MAG: TonB family protein [Pseudomonadota bacterium]|nr:TonB family protein [Pseudomonadota bacterium]
MLARDGGATRASVLSFSLASDIVELVIFTTDEIFLQTLREAVGGSRRLWHVPSADKVSDLLLAGEVGILVLDVQALPEAASVFVTEIKRQFPELVVIVAGNREAETSLANLIMAGVIYRFIHKPMSPGRAKLFTDAAVKKYDEQRRRLPVRPDIAWTPKGNRRLLIGAASGALLAGVVAIWAVRHGAREHAAGNGNLFEAPELARTPAAVPGRSGLAALHERLLAQAENALLEERLDEAARAIDAARKSGANASRIAFLTAQLAKARERLKQAMAQAAQKKLPRMAAESNVQNVPQLASKQADTEARGQLPQTSTAEPPRHDHPIEDAADGIKAADSSAESRVEPRPVEPQAPAGSIPDFVSASHLTLLKSVKPLYPLRAELTKTEGWVELDFTVTESGEVKGITVHAAAPAGVFDHAAIAALSQWRYKPVLEGGKPTAQHSRIRIRFALSG